MTLFLKNENGSSIWVDISRKVGKTFPISSTANRIWTPTVMEPSVSQTLRLLLRGWPAGTRPRWCSRGRSSCPWGWSARTAAAPPVWPRRCCSLRGLRRSSRGPSLARRGTAATWGQLWTSSSTGRWWSRPCLRRGLRTRRRCWRRHRYCGYRAGHGGCWIWRGFHHCHHCCHRHTSCSWICGNRTFSFLKED